jgi:hypothetical protein
MTAFTDIGQMFVLDFLVTFAIVRFIYYPPRRSKDYVFTFFGFNAITFLISSLLSSADLSVGFGFGLFAIFSILRYRSEPIPLREMTYLFVVMALPVVNGVLVGQGQWAASLLANLALMTVLLVAEKGWGFQYEVRQTVTYEKIELIRPGRRQLLLADLRQRTGLPIKRLEIGSIDFLRDTAEINITYDAAAAQRVDLASAALDHRRVPGAGQVAIATQDETREARV